MNIYMYIHIYTYQDEARVITKSELFLDDFV